MPDEQLDTKSTPEAETLLMAQIDAGDTRIVVDFPKTDYMSSAGLRIFLNTTSLL